MTAISTTFAPARTLLRPALPFALLAHAMDVWVQRRRLATLDAAQLADLGLSAERAAAEARRPIWDLPRW